VQETIMAGEERNGRLASGDVTLFWRVFGEHGATPMLLMHGANYFDSYDWVGVCRSLGADREAASFDKRGFGESTWSPSKDYSLDANMGDIVAVIDKLKWEKPIVVGHSASGRLAIAFASKFPTRVSRLVVVDSGMNRDAGGPKATVGNPPLVFESVEATMAHFAKLHNPPRISSDRERAEHALVRVANGYMLKRDPDFQNTKPQGESAQLPQGKNLDVWAMLDAVKCPTMVVRGSRSDRWTPEILERMQRDYPKIEWEMVDSQHDVPHQAPDQLVEHLRTFAGAA
jgi:pimeloyl-ACP methyl ester carboxylesterase